VEAEAACVAMGGHLASVHSPEDWASIEYLIATSTDASMQSSGSGSGDNGADAWCAVPNTQSAC
jgi:hypothetical protein